MLHVLPSRTTIISLIIIGSIIAVVISISPQKEITGLVTGEQMNESNETGFTTNATTNITNITSDGTGAMNGSIETNITESPLGFEIVEPSIKLLKPQYYAGEDVVLEVRSGGKITNVLVLDPVGNNYTCSKVEPADGAELCILERKTSIVLGNYIALLLENQTILDQTKFEIIPLPELEISVTTDKTQYTQGEVVHILIETNREAIISTKIIDPLEREELLETHKINLTYYTADFIDTTNIVLGNYTVMVTTPEINASVVFEITYAPPITSHNIVKNALGELLEGEIIFKQVDIEKHKTNLGEALQIPRGIYDVEIHLINQPVKSIILKNASLQKDTTEIMLFDDAPEVGDFLEVFAIEPLINFSKAEVLRHSKGTILYKCKDWDFPNRICPNEWTKIQDMKEDEDYLFTFDPSDPGFGEGKRKKKLNVTFDRDLECGPGCGKHKAPSETNVNMTITAIVIEPMKNVTFSDIYNTEWTVINPNGGNISAYNTTHNRISWYVGNVSDSVSRWYIIKSPKRRLPAKKYYFISELDGYQSDPWMVIVADPPGKIWDDYDEPCTSTHTSCIPSNATEAVRYNVSVYWYLGSGSPDSWDFDVMLQYGANTTIGEDASTSIPRGTVCGTNITILIDEYVVDCSGPWTCTDHNNGTITLTSTSDGSPTANLSYEIKFCANAAGNKYDVVQEVVRDDSPGGTAAERGGWVEAWGVTPAVKILNVTLITPVAGSSTNISQGATFWVNASVRCLNGDCGTVVGSVRYNRTTSEPDFLINYTDVNGIPFSNSSGEIPWSCGTLNQDELCTLNWTVNATGAPWNSSYLDVNFTSSDANIPDNDTANFQINITEALYCTGSVYNPPGNWDITTATTCIDRDIPVDGNITVSGSGSLTLIRTNITFNVTANQNFFFVDSADLWSINSTIRTNDTNFAFKFNITTGKAAGNVVQLNGTNITSSGWWTYPPVDIWIYNSDNVVIKDSNITNTNAILIQNSDGNLLIDNSNMTLTGSTYGIRLANVSNVTISRSKINSTAGDGIYALDWVNDTTIYDNWIYPASDERGIYISKSGPGNNITGNDIWGNGDVIYIISSFSIPSNLTIAHNTLNSIGVASTYGIYTQYQDNITIFNNTIDVTKEGIFIYGIVDGNITKNRIKNSGSSGYTLSISVSNFTNVFGNNFTSHASGSAWASGGNLTFYRNNFTLETTAGTGKVGLYLKNVYNSNFTDNNVTISQGLGDALNINFSNSNYFYNNFIWANPGEANNSVSVHGSSTGNSFINDYLTSGAWNDDVYFTGSGNLNFTNVTFNKIKVSFGAGSTAKLYVNWYVKGFVNDSSDTPIADANFSAWNVTDAFLWWNWTNASGYTDIMTIQDYVQDTNGESSQQNTTFNATKTGYGTGEVSINITHPLYPEFYPPFMQVNITLFVSGGILNVTLITPSAGSSTNVTQNTTFWVNASVRCMGGNCGTVVGSVRYNRTTSEPDFLINTTLNGIPFSNSSGEIPWSCGTLNQDELCTLNWTVNATGTINTSYYLDVNFTSSVGGIVDNDTANFQINISRPPDQTPPSVTINDPNAGENYSGDILINATVIDSYSGVDDSKVYYWIENASGNQTAWTQMSNISSGDPSWFNATFDSTTIPDGTYNVTINASDIAGNENVSEKVEFIIDNTNPAVGYIEPSQDEKKTSSFLINVSINDSTSGIEIAYYWIENVSGNVTAWTAMSLGSGTIYSGFWNATFDPSGLAYSTYNITTNATDYAGNQNATEKRQFIYTHPILNVTLITPSAGSSTNVTQNTTFWVNASVRCMGGNCGTVVGSVRYNRTTSEPDFLINYTDVNGIPFSNSSGEIPWSCGTLNQDELCTLNWTVNATGNAGTSYYLDVNFTSSDANIPDNDTSNFQINITRLPYCFPNGNYSGKGNWDISGSVTCENETIWLNGNLTILNGADLTFKNITLRVNGSGGSDNESHIFVGGSMYVARFSNITNGENNTYKFRFEVNETAGTLHLNDSYLSWAGWGSVNPGLKIARSAASYEKNIKMINSTIKNCYSGITLDDVDDTEIKNSNLSGGYYGIWMTGSSGWKSKRTEIEGNEIYNYSEGIYGDEYSVNATIFNNSIRNTTKGVFFGFSSCGDPSYFFYYNISKNNISQSSYGVSSATTGGNTIEGNDFESITDKAIDFSCYIWNSTVSNNRIFNSNTSFLLWTGTYNNTVISNNLTNSSTYGIRLSSAADNEIRNNNITSTANGYGIHASGSDNNEFRNNYVKSENQNAIYLTGSDGVTVANSSIETTGTGYYALNYSSSSYVIIYNSTLISVNNNTDIFMNDTGNLTLVNVTFNKSAVDFTTATTTKLFVKWYVQGYVNDTAGSPIADANFSAWNVTDAFLWWNWTNASGYTDWTEIQEYVQNISANVSQQNTTFNVTKTGYRTGEVNLNVTVSMQINITLPRPYCFPNGNYSGKGNWDISGSVTCENETIPLNGNLTIYDGADLTFKNITLKVNGSSDGEYSVFVGGSMYVARFSNITNGDTTTAEFRFEINSSANAFHFNDSYLSECGYSSTYPGLKSQIPSIIKNASIFRSYTGLYLTADRNNITESIINTSFRGIRLVNSNSNLIKFNNVTSEDNAVLFMDNSDYNNISWNNFTTGVSTTWLSDVDYSNFSNNIYNSSTYYAMMLSSYSSSNNFMDEVLYGQKGLLIQTSSNNNDFIDTEFTSTLDYAVKNHDSNNNKIYNSTINGSDSTKDIKMNNTGNLTLVNVTFNKSAVDFTTATTTKLFVKWYVQGYVNDTAGSPIADANFSAWNVTDAFLWWNWTNASGYTDWTEIQEYVQNISANVSQQNTTFNATKTGYPTGEVSLNVTISMQVNITLVSAEPSNTSLEKILTNTSTSDKFQITLNVTNKGGGGDVIITAHDFVPSGFAASNFSPMYTANASYQGGYIYIWNLTISGGDSQLVYYNITGSGDYNVTDTYLIGIDPIPF